MMLMMMKTMMMTMMMKDSKLLLLIVVVVVAVDLGWRCIDSVDSRVVDSIVVEALRLDRRVAGVDDDDDIVVGVQRSEALPP
jgi:hypothetical protein